MGKLLLRRMAWVLPTLLVVSFLVFFLLDFSNVDPARVLAGPTAPDEQVVQLRQDLGLDDPVFVRYVRWLGKATHGDLGKSYYTGQSVSDAMAQRVPVTVSLALVALLLTAGLGLFFGVVAALRPRGLIDRAVTTAASLLVALPTFWVGLLFILYLAVYHHLFPAIGYIKFTDNPWEWFRHIIMASVVLAMWTSAPLALQLKGSLTETMGRDYILSARAKGIRGRTLIFKHALRNAAIPVVTLFSLQAAYLIGGTAVIEQVFNLPGLGTLATSSASGADTNPLLGVVTFFVAVVITINLLTDIFYGFLNPKLRT
jgi:peptide/nickel transport system permease protein